MAAMDSHHSNTSSTTLPGDSSREEDDNNAAATFAPINTHTSTFSRIRRSLSNPRSPDLSQKESRDPNLDIDLPYRTLSAQANLDEYRVESGQKDGGERRYKLVTFTPGDPENPKNWSKAYKWWCTMCVALTCFVVAFASSVITADIKGVTEDLDVSNELALVSISIFVVGFGVGPMIFAPLSEIYGRRIIYGSTLLIAVIFIIPCAVAKNIETLLVCRAIDGIAFSAPMTLVGGTLADLWRNEERGVPMAAFSAAPFIGPASELPLNSSISSLY
ncbi:hypothetical protein NM208_g8643 [Fusarium decemcellulare]|uniref:Uncharacterized protein n=1 Tax=Fusarium decemcellulare TaxID=57161 RepID=A0ACC1S4N0_9HYPO|nr:hypothetical protein NM208_g8643 [Fusarium decemcellulare]